MQCMSCGSANAADAKFCSQCGNRLRMTCGVCATVNDPDSRFCKECGSSLQAASTAAQAAEEPAPPAAPPADVSGAEDNLTRYIPDQLLRRIREARAGGAMRGERRTVTMLFADIQGSTAAAEKMDPEDWADIMNGAFRHLIEPVYRYEGTLARLQGDAILAFFGAPLAHEDDPVRAVRAGLDIVGALRGYAEEVQARTGVPVAVRVGINTGLVVVGEVGSDLRVEYTALGDAINVAARMEQTAAPGTVRVADGTAALLGGMFRLEEIGPVEVKGKTEPVPAWEVVALASAAGDRAALTPLVGREPELSALQSVGARVRDGVGGICTVVAEAGLGKSRLLGALRDEMEAATTLADAFEQDGDVAWLHGSSRSFETGVPYATVGAALQRWLGLDGTAEQQWERIVAAVQDAGLADPDAAAFLAGVASTPLPAPQEQLITALEPPVLARRTAAAVLDYLAGEAGRRPVVLVFDDLHWGDALSLALVERVMSVTDTAAVALVLALRPYRDDAAWRLVETAARDFGHRLTSVQLEPLDDTATQGLLAALLDDGVDKETRERILARADGNPLFVEELARAWEAAPTSAAPHVGLPLSLQGLLTARLDQLDDAPRHLAQVASVVGGDFDTQTVNALLDDTVDIDAAVADLVRHGIILERRRRPEPVYAFRHALIQDAAYATTLLRTRRELHARLGEFLEQRRPGAAAEIARHHQEAGNHGRAFPYLVQAGGHALRSMALTDAIRLFTSALDAMPADAAPDLVEAAHSGLGDAYQLIPDLSLAAATYQRLFDYGASTSRPSSQVAALNRLGLATAQHAGDFIKADQYLSQAREIAEDCGDELGLAEYHMNACFLAVMQGELERAVEHDAATARIGTDQGVAQVRLAGLMRQAMNSMSTLRFGDARELYDDSLKAAEDLGDLASLAALRAMVGSDLCLLEGDYRKAREALAENVAPLERFSSFYAPLALGRLADAALALGDVEDALAAAAKGRRAADATGLLFADGVSAATMAHAYARCGLSAEHDAARAAAVASFVGAMGGMIASTTWRQLGDASQCLGRDEDAAQDYATGLHASSTTRLWERPKLLIGAAMIDLASGDAAAARRRTEEATAYVMTHGLATYDADVALAVAQIAMAAGELSDAEAHLQRAWDVAVAQGRRLIARDIAVRRSEVARRQGRDEEATGHRAQAAHLTEAMASSFADEALRAAFLDRSSVLQPDLPGS